MEEFRLNANGVRTISPLDFLSFLQLESNAKLVFTDSGGVQEETCILSVPCVTLRDNTERPETLEVGSNVLAGTSPKEMVRCTRIMVERQGGWMNLFGDGRSGQRILRLLVENLAKLN